MAFCDNKGTISLAILHLFESFLCFVAIHDVLERIFFNVADYPFFARAVAWRNISPRVDEEEVGEGAASRAVSSIVAA